MFKQMVDIFFRPLHSTFQKRMGAQVQIGAGVNPYLPLLFLGVDSQARGSYCVGNMQGSSNKNPVQQGVNARPTIGVKLTSLFLLPSLMPRATHRHLL